MLLKTTAAIALAGGLAIGASTIASAQKAPGPGASEYAPGHSTTNIPPGRGGVRGETWTPPGKLMQQDSETMGSSLNDKRKAKSRSKN